MQIIPEATFRMQRGEEKILSRTYWCRCLRRPKEFLFSQPLSWDQRKDEYLINIPKSTSEISPVSPHLLLKSFVQPPNDK